MKPPTCRACGIAEWNHTCQQIAPERPRKPPAKPAQPRPATQPAEGTIAPPGQCPYCDNRRAANAAAAKRLRQELRASREGA